MYGASAKAYVALDKGYKAMATRTLKLESYAEAQELHEDPRGAAGTEDSVGLYLHDIGAYPLLTADEERELARAMERGRAAARRLEADLTGEERVLAAHEVEEGERARKRMIECNLRLVVSIASRYGGRGLPLPDLIEEGNLGLIRATEKFDHHKGYRFSTYAVWWIRQAMSRAIDSQARTVRLPGHIVERLGHIAKATQKLTQDLGREPTGEELAREAGLKPDQVREAIKASQRTVSLEQPWGENGELTLAEHIEDEGWAHLADHLSAEMLREGVFAALGELSEREQRVLALRYGLGGERRRTLEEAGKLLGVTRERVRQIEKEALAKLRHAPHCASLHARLQDVA